MYVTSAGVVDAKPIEASNPTFKEYSAELSTPAVNVGVSPVDALCKAIPVIKLFPFLTP